MAAKPPFDRLKAYKPMAIVNAPPGERKHLLRRFWFPAVLLLALAAGGLAFSAWAVAAAGTGLLWITLAFFALTSLGWFLVRRRRDPVAG